MRPNPTQPHDGDSDRIIYLGDVRRKRSARRRQAPDKHYLAVIGALAIAAWGVWLTVLVTLPPQRLLTYLAFFTPMFVAVTCTGAVLSYAVDWRRGYFPSLAACLRRGVLAAAVVVINLAALAAHRWMLPVLAITVVGAVLLDVAVGLRRN